MRATGQQIDHNELTDGTTVMALLTERPTYLVARGHRQIIRTDLTVERHILATYDAPGWPPSSWLVQFRNRTDDGDERTLAESSNYWLVDAFDAIVAELQWRAPWSTAYAL